MEMVGCIKSFKDPTPSEESDRREKDVEPADEKLDAMQLKISKIEGEISRLDMMQHATEISAAAAHQKVATVESICRALPGGESLAKVQDTTTTVSTNNIPSSSKQLASQGVHYKGWGPNVSQPCTVTDPKPALNAV